MNKLTDLEICKRIAEIFYEHNEFFTWDYSDCGEFIVDNSGEEFNPLKDDGLCFRLMIKYCIELGFYEDEGKAMHYTYFETKNGEIKSCGDYESPNEVICLAVIGMNQGSK